MSVFLHLSPLPLLLAASLLVSSPAAAQKYRTAVGVRLGASDLGLTVQQRIAEKTTLEGLALFRDQETTGTLLLERHHGILGPSLNYYFGIGGHLGAHQEYGTVGGADALVGAEWKLPILPFVVSFDFKPTLEFNNDKQVRLPTALSLRYVLVRDKRSLLGRLLDGDNDRPRRRRD